MSDDTLRFALQVAAIFLGGGSVQLAIFLFRRKSEIRGLDVASDSTALNSANQYIVTLQAGDKTNREDIATLKAELVSATDKWSRERNRLIEQLELTHDENTRLAGIIATLRTDLDIARRQIDDLRNRI